MWVYFGLSNLTLQNAFSGGFDGDILCSRRRRTSGPVVGKVGSCPGQLPCHGGLLLLWQISNRNLLNLLSKNWIHGLQNVKTDKSRIITLTMHISQKILTWQACTVTLAKVQALKIPTIFGIWGPESRWAMFGDKSIVSTLHGMMLIVRHFGK